MLNEPITQDYLRRNEPLPTAVDVIIAGGGPAGLLLASLLSGKLKVAVLERNSFGRTSKFWLTNRDRLARHGLAPSIIYETQRATVGTFLGVPAVAIGNFAVVEELHLLATLLSRCSAAGVALIDRADVLSFVSNPAHISVHTRRGEIRARLLVDATGGLSAIAATYRLHDLLGFYSIYGGHINDVALASDDIVGAYVGRLGDPPPLFEIIPTSRTSAFVIVFVASSRIIPPAALRASFEDHLRHNPFLIAGARTAHATPKFGVIPIGRARRRVLPGLVAFGEAAMIQAPLLGAAFNEVLDHAEGAAASIRRAFEASRGGVITTELRHGSSKMWNDLLQHQLARKLTDCSLEEFEALVSFLGDLGPQRAYRLFCSTLGRLDLITAGALSLKLLRKSPLKEQRSDAGPSWITRPSE